MKLGPRGERVAARHLKRIGYRIIARNYTCPAGEVDLVTAEGDTIVFVEVKTRSSNDAEDPERSVDHRKRRQLTRVARYFLAARAAHEIPCRFDVVAVVMPDRGKPLVEHFINAFEPTYP